MMMNEQNRRGSSWYKYAVLLPMVLVAFMVSAQKPKSTSTVSTLKDGRTFQATYDPAPVSANIPKDSTSSNANNQEVISPKYPGGTKMLYKYFVDNCKYLPLTRNHISQKPTSVHFVVKGDGSISSIEVRNSPSEEFTADVMRVLKQMPKWKPGMIGGKPSDMAMNFYLPKESNSEKTVEKPRVTKDESGVYDAAAVMPLYPGGNVKLYEMLAKNVRYPESCRDAGVEGRVVVEFIVKSDGSVSDMRATNSPHPDMTAEALRVLNLMPTWTPGTVDGKPVNVRLHVPVMFKLNSSKEPMYVIDNSDLDFRSEDDSRSSKLRIRNSDGSNSDVLKLPLSKQPLYVVNGEIWDSINSISVEQIEDLTILKKDNENYQKYLQLSERAKNGVVVITIKN